jgi:4-hydroxymandelate oxidase
MKNRDHNGVLEDGLASKVSLLNLFDYEERARTTMDPLAYELVASGGADEITVRWNREAFDNIRLRPRVLADVSKVDTRADLFGENLPFPILIAPTATHCLYHPGGEIATARGAGAAGATYVVSTYTTTPIEDIAAAATEPLWFQLYLQHDKGATKDLVQRVEAAGCKALCVTVDTPTFGIRNRQQRAGFSYQNLPLDVSTPYVAASFEPVSMNWRDIDWLRSFSRIPILLKGILDPRDADEAVKQGVAGVIVSNHGGRNLDTVPASIDALAPVAEKVAGRVPILMDGGLRRGTDILKALASGATAVLIGRPICFGLGVAGAEGVDRVVNILRAELETAMALSGRPTIESIDRTVLWSTPI